MRSFISGLTAALFLINLAAQETEIIYLSGTGYDDTKIWEFFCTQGMNSNRWATIEVPSCWELQGFGSYNYGHDKSKVNERGLYRKTFFALPSWKGRHITLVFEGVMTDAEVLINGKSAGPIHQGAFYRFSYDISELLNFNDSNLLEVKVSKVSANEFVNAAEREADYWTFGGIYRPVYLAIKPEDHIERVAIDALADGSFKMDVFHTLSRNNIVISVQLKTSDGLPAGKPFGIQADKNTNRATLFARIDQPALWSPEFPNLYQAEVSLQVNGDTIHRVTEHFGFRTVEIKKQDGIYINGARLMFKGINRHSFWPESGRTTSKALSIRDVLLMKEMNMNAVRMSHYPPDVHFLDACDSLGLFVLDELAGWQKPPYDTETGQKLVKEMVTRDVNHPSVVLWDNGNEGGWNRELDAVFQEYDIQKRHVIHPWEIFDGTDTQHYKPYYYGNGTFYQGREIFFPTEFLHGLYDGGHGAGLDDHWNLMTHNPLSAGMFLWCLIDEGVVRTDKNGWIDTDSNNAPDGILGPHREKEGSFYTIKEIWSPIQINMLNLPVDFSGEVIVENSYLFTNLKDCKFERTLAVFQSPFLKKEKYSTIIRQELLSPDIPPGEEGTVDLKLPADWKSYDVICLRATDPHGQELWTWSWPVKTNEQIALSARIRTSEWPVRVSETEDYLNVSVSDLFLEFSKKTGLINSIVKNDTWVPLWNGPQILSNQEIKVTVIEHFKEGENYIISAIFDQPENKIKWTIMPDGWLVLDYQYEISGEFDYAGIGFTFPDSIVTGVRYLGGGPYRVWKNRLKGTAFDIWEKTYNNTVTGESWEYPEFKGYYKDPVWVWIENSAVPFLIVNTTSDCYLHLFTPDPPHGAFNDHTAPPFPATDISILHAISPIGTKFRKAEEHGPQGQKNMFFPFGMPAIKSGTIWLYFGDPLTGIIIPPQ